MKTRSAALRLPGVMLLLVVAGCAPQAPASSYLASPIAAREARIWFYRSGSPSGSIETRLVRLNGATVGASEFGCAFYRDVPPGHYHITVDTRGDDSTQVADVDVTVGQQAYAKITSLRNPVIDGDDLFYVWLTPEKPAEAEIATLYFAGGTEPPRLSAAVN
jgi:hypothetical protein